MQISSNRLLLLPAKVVQAITHQMYDELSSRLEVNPASMASGNPFNPSMRAMEISWTPRFLSSATTLQPGLGILGLGNPDREQLLFARQMGYPGLDRR